MISVKKVIPIFLIVLSGILSVLVLEGILRMTDYTYYPMRIQVLGTTSYRDETAPKGDFRFYHMFGDEAFEYDPQLLWRPSPKYEIFKDGVSINFFNSLGYPGPLFDESNKSGKYRVVGLGDSNTLGIRDYDSQTGREVSWPGYLEHLLGEGFEVINAGAWGYSSYQIHKRFYQVLKYKPSMVIVSVSANDAHQGGISDKQYLFMQIVKT